MPCAHAVAVPPCLDLTKFVASQKEQGFEYWVESDFEGRTDRIFFVLDGAEEEYAKCKGLNTVMFDTSFGTNCYGMKLGCFTTVSETGQGTRHLMILR